MTFYFQDSSDTSSTSESVFQRGSSRSLSRSGRKKLSRDMISAPRGQVQVNIWNLKLSKYKRLLKNKERKHWARGFCSSVTKKIRIAVDKKNMAKNLRRDRDQGKFSLGERVKKIENLSSDLLRQWFVNFSTRVTWASTVSTLGTLPDFSTSSLPPTPACLASRPAGNRSHSGRRAIPRRNLLL